jgi:hypothetical protein
MIQVIPQRIAAKPLMTAQFPPGAEAMMTGVMKRFLVFTVAMVAVSFSTAQASMVIDLTTAGFNSGFLTDAKGNQFFVTTDATQSTGSGNWDAFSRIQHNGNEQGYNTPTNHVLDNVDGSNTHLVTLGQIPTVTSGGQVYRVFGLDINQVNSQPGALLSLNQVQIFSSTTDPMATGVVTPATATTPPQIAFGAGFTEDFRLNNSSNPNFFEIQLNSQLNAGSGHDNMLLYVNNSAFAGLPDSTLITLYSQFGNPPGTYPSNSGFEEWAAILNASSIPVPVPEPATVIQVCMTGLFVLGYAWRRRAKAAASISRGEVSGSGDPQS